MLTLHDFQNIVILAIMRRTNTTKLEISKAESVEILEEAIQAGKGSLSISWDDNGNVTAELTGQ